MVRALDAASAGEPDGETGDLVDAALDRFVELGLLQESTSLHRRALGAVAVKGLAAGLVLSVMVPTRAAAGSIPCSTYTNETESNQTYDCSWIDDACVYDP